MYSSLHVIWSEWWYFSVISSEGKIKFSWVCRLLTCETWRSSALKERHIYGNILHHNDLIDPNQTLHISNSVTRDSHLYIKREYTNNKTGEKLALFQASTSFPWRRARACAENSTVNQLSTADSGAHAQIATSNSMSFALKAGLKHQPEKSKYFCVHNTFTLYTSCWVFYLWK